MQKGKPERFPPLPVESSSLLSENGPELIITKVQKNVKVSKKSRTILWYISFLGFIINSMVRCNLNIAIVSMVVPRNATHGNQTQLTECFNHSSISLIDSESSMPRNVIERGFSVERNIMEFFRISYNQNGFNWNEYEQGLILGSFYWLYWSTQFLGGYLAKRYGTKFVFGMSNFVACIMSSLMPIAAYLNFNSLLVLRTMQGIINGFTWPSMHNIISEWIPPNERSRFMSAYMGGSFALAVCYPLFGFIITISSWEWIFHFCTVSGIVWFILWQYFVYDSPSEHPRIDSNELNYISTAVGHSVQKDVKIPWKSIFTSSPFWFSVVAHWGGLWQIFTLIVQLPTYYKYIHGFDYQVLGILSGVPHILRVGFSVIFAMMIDYVLSAKTLTRTNARKLSAFITCIVSGISTVCLAYVACDHVMAVVFTSISIALLGAHTSSSLAIFVDLAPNYSSILMGLATSICVLTGTFTSYIVGVLTNNKQNIQQWKFVFLISSGISIACGFLYILFGSSEEQSWNKSSKAVEMKSLNGTKVDQSSRGQNA